MRNVIHKRNLKVDTPNASSLIRPSGDRSPVMTPEARSLVEKHIGLVGMHLRKRVPTPPSPRRDREYEDLFQEGCLALARAAMEYDPERHGVFVAYAIQRIRRTVHQALHEQFALMRVPPNRLREAKHSPEARRLQTVVQLPDEAMVASEHAPGSLGNPHGRETFGHRLRQRYERAVRLALRSLEQRPWPRRDPTPILRRFAEERILIEHEALRTPLRQIARDFEISSSRASAYERRLTQEVENQVRQDPQMPLLMRMIRENEGQADGLLDERQCRELEDSEELQFARRFARMDRTDKAGTLMTLLEHANIEMNEVARNLFRLSRASDGAEIALSV